MNIKNVNNPTNNLPLHTYNPKKHPDAKVPVIDLANGSLGLTLKSQKSSGFPKSNPRFYGWEKALNR